MTIVYLNGDYVPAEQARINVFDRGFLFGDGVYEVVPVYDDLLHRFDAHLARLQRSLEALSITNPYRIEQWREMAVQLLQRNQLHHASFYCQVTRAGVAGKRDHAYGKASEASVLAFVQEWSAGQLSPSENGLSVVTVPDTRWLRCDIKSINLLGNVMARQQAQQIGADEALLERDGVVREGSSSNLYLVKNGVIKTAAESPLILSGITRMVVLELAKKLSWPVHLADFSLDELLDADEVWISSSLREVRAVTRINGAIINDGKIGPYYRQIMSAFRADIKAAT